MKRTTAQMANDSTARPSGVRGSLDGEKQKIGIVTARFNSDITSKLEDGALRTLRALGVGSRDIRVVSVPGAVEITVAARALLKQGCDAVIALGCVIRGETTHYESVVGAVDSGCTQLQLEFGQPVVFGVITTENYAQAVDRIGGHHGHKGEEAAEVAVEMVNLLKLLNAKPQGRKIRS